MKYRKKSIPINHFRNILIFLCQILILSSCAFILAQPIVRAEQQDQYSEKVAIIDASASMRAKYDDGTNITRFEKAVEKVKLLANEVAANDGLITVILAGTEASYVVQRTGGSNRAATIAALDKLIENPRQLQCTYGTADIDGAMELAQKITLDNPDTEVIYYTGTNYLNPDKVKVEYVGDVSDWNVSILDVRAVMEENYYRFYVDIACYGIPKTVNVYCELTGTNYDNATIEVECLADCNSEVKTLTFGINENDNDEVVSAYSFETVHVYVDEEDCFLDDNSFYLYGGKPETLKMLYYSTLSNNFFGGVTLALRERMSSRWTIDLDEVKGINAQQQLIEPVTEGYDIYIYEHHMPQVMPDDGVVILINPDFEPKNSGFALGAPGGPYNMEMKLSAGDPHPIMNNLVAENITVTWFRSISTYDDYTPILYFDKYVVGLVKNTANEKIVVLTLNLNLSNFPLTFEFPAFMYNMFEYFFPSTVSKHAFETNEMITFNSRSDKLFVTGPNSIEEEITSFPQEMSLLEPGTYTTTQTLISGAQVVDNFFVRIPKAESEITRTVDQLVNPQYSEKENIPDMDLVFFFALALVALLFVEWWLQSRDQF